MRRYFVNRGVSGDVAGNENLHTVENPTQLFFEQYNIRPLVRRQQRYTYRRSRYLPFSLILFFVITTALLNVYALVTKENINAMRFPSSLLQIALEQQHSNTRLFSRIPNYLDHLTLCKTTAPAIPEHSMSYRTSILHHSAVTSLSQKTQMADTVPKSPQNLLHHSTLQNMKDKISQVPSITDSLENVFSYDLPEGKCVGLRLPKDYPVNNSASLDPELMRSNENDWIKQTLHADEVQFGIDLPSEQAKMTFYLGRLAMRTALSLACKKEEERNAGELSSIISNEQQSKLLPCVSSSGPSILKDQYGRPQVPTGFIGSISHKKNLGVALVTTSNDDSLATTRGIGVDIEQRFSRRKDLAKRVLTEWEINNLGKIEGVTRDEEVLLRFSLKESVYKAMHPLICQFVGFKEAEITPNDDGTATVKLNLKSGAQERFQNVEAHWKRIEDDFFLTSSSVILKKQ